MREHLFLETAGMRLAVLLLLFVGAVASGVVHAFPRSFVFQVVHWTILFTPRNSRDCAKNSCGLLQLEIPYKWGEKGLLPFTLQGKGSTNVNFEGSEG